MNQQKFLTDSQQWADYYQHSQDWNLIVPNLILGGRLAAPPRGTTAVLNVCGTDDTFEVAHYKWSPIPDCSPAPSLKWLKEQVAWVAKHVESKRVTYVHCMAGISRSAMVTAAYLMSSRKIDRDHALMLIRRQRWEANPNPAFMDLLARYGIRR